MHPLAGAIRCSTRCPARLSRHVLKHFVPPAAGARSYSATSLPPVQEQDAAAAPRKGTPVKKRDLQGLGFPDLMKPDPLMDLQQSKTFKPKKRTRFASRVVVRNDPSMFLAEREIREKERGGPVEETRAPIDEDAEDEMNPGQHLPLNATERAALHKYPLFSRRVTQQTGKGKIHRNYVLVVVGNGAGLVGYGEGKSEDNRKAYEMAEIEAVRNMDRVERFEDRTLFTDMETKLGATQIILRPRPVGFGLSCNPNVHQILKAAGIKDASAKVWGSRNPLNVIKATFRLLQAGHAPLSMGDGFGGPSRKLDKGMGVRSRSEVERERGRKLIDLRT